MKGRRHTPEQIVRKHDANRLIAEGKSMAVVLKQLGVAEQTYYRWRKAGSSLPTRPRGSDSSRVRTPV